MLRVSGAFQAFPRSLAGAPHFRPSRGLAPCAAVPGCSTPTPGFGSGICESESHAGPVRWAGPRGIVTKRTNLPRLGGPLLGPEPGLPPVTQVDDVCSSRWPSGQAPYWAHCHRQVQTFAVTGVPCRGREGAGPMLGAQPLSPSPVKRTNRAFASSSAHRGPRCICPAPARRVVRGRGCRHCYPLD